jgi:hypothetical protein
LQTWVRKQRFPGLGELGRRLIEHDGARQPEAMFTSEPFRHDGFDSSFLHDSHKALKFPDAAYHVWELIKYRWIPPILG